MGGRDGRTKNGRGKIGGIIASSGANIRYAALSVVGQLFGRRRAKHYHYGTVCGSLGSRRTKHAIVFDASATMYAAV